MNDETKKLLQETNYGCKMALKNMKHIIEDADDCDLMKVVISSIDDHEKLEEKTGNALRENRYEEKAVSAMLDTFSDVTTELKLLWRDDTPRIAEMLVDGCNMGIKSISQILNQCEHASDMAKKYAEELVHVEDRLLRKLQPFL